MQGLCRRWLCVVVLCAVVTPFATLSANFIAIAADHDSVGADDSRRRFTVRDSIEATQVVHDFGTDPVQISPDGNRYLVVLQRGDVARNGSWVELISGGTSSLDDASDVATVARLFSTSTEQIDRLIRNIHWLGDSEHVVFLWDNGRVPAHIVEANVRTHEMRTLARRPTSIVDYDISASGDSIVLMSQAPRDQSKVSELMDKGFAITDQSIWSLLEGNLDGWTQWRHYETFALSPAGSGMRKVREADLTWVTRPELLQLSPDGRYAIAERPVAEVPHGWDAYTEHVFKDTYLPAARQHPASPNWIRQYFIIDIEHGTSRPLWNAPEVPGGRIVWSSDSRNVIIGPTFIPTSDANPIGLAGRAVVELNVATGRFVQFSLPEDLPDGGYRPLRWSKGNEVELGTTVSEQHDHNLQFHKVGDEWALMTEASPRAGSRAVRIELRQSPNMPPVLYAVEVSSGRDRQVRDLNPELKKDVTLARVEVVHWKATDGKPWTGVLYYPVRHDPSRRYPLVIQTHGYSSTDFSLDGAFTTAFAAQPLANRDIAVLQLGGPDAGTKDDYSLTPREAGIYIAGIEGAIECFVAAGMTDRERVGIIGFSWTVFTVEYILTHSQFPFAAAEVADGIDGGYFQYVLVGSDRKPFQEALKGAAPFGEGLKAWISEAPGFRADKIRAPLRMEIDSGPMDEVLADWEMFNNLRYLRKPAELFVIPHIDRGVHVLQNPAQRLASQGSTVDWFCFWLKDEEEPDPAKTPQYARWHELRTMQSQNSPASGRDR
jgi:hypothetical protein